jgi:hypothetical protein
LGNAAGSSQANIGTLEIPAFGAFGTFGSVESAAGAAFCSAPLATLPVERSPWVAPKSLVRLGIAEGPVPAGLAWTLLELAATAAAIVCSGTAAASAVEVESFRIAPKSLVRLGVAEGPVPAGLAWTLLEPATTAAAIVCSGIAAASAAEVESFWVAPKSLVRLGIAEGPVPAGLAWTLLEPAATAAAIVCSGIAAASAVEVESFWIAPKSLVRLGVAEGPVPAGLAWTLLEPAATAAAIVCSGIAAASAVEVAERPLVPAVVRAPGLRNEPVAALSNPSLMTKENLPETGGGCGGRGWGEIAARAAASELPAACGRAGNRSSSEVGAADSWRFRTGFGNAAGSSQANIGTLETPAFGAFESVESAAGLAFCSTPLATLPVESLMTEDDLSETGGGCGGRGWGEIAARAAASGLPAACGPAGNRSSSEVGALLSDD